MYEAVESVVRQDLSRDTVNKVIRITVDRLAESQDYVQHLTTNLIKNQSLTVPIIHRVKHPVQVADYEKAKVYSQRNVRAKQTGQVTRPSPLAGITSDSLYTLTKNGKRNGRRKRAFQLQNHINCLDRQAGSVDPARISPMSTKSVNIIREPKVSKRWIG